jgi:hypothetical protein
MATIKPWARRTTETSKAYEAFEAYRDMGHKRTLRAVGEVLGKSETVLSRWSSQHDWVARAAAWDSVPSEAIAEAYAERARKIAAQHDRLATKLMAKMERNLDLLPDGADPSMRWSTAVSTARQSHQFSAELAKPESTVKEEISKQIEALINRLAGE